MTDILKKLSNSLKGHSGFNNRHEGATKAKLEFTDPDDPRLLYRVSPRSKRISLRMKPSDRLVIVTMPSERSMSKARAFVKAQADWINIQFETLPPAHPFVPDGMIYFRGLRTRLIFTEGRGRPILDTDAQTLTVPAPDIDAFNGRVKRWLIRQARERLTDTTHHYAEVLGKTVEKISVRDTTTRWGSCITRKGKGHISYSWRLIGAPDYVLDYVCAHECAHMIEANHSPAYWRVVKDIFPDLNRAKNWLKHNGAVLHAMGASL